MASGYGQDGFGMTKWFLLLLVYVQSPAYALEAEPFRCRSEKFYKITEAEERLNLQVLNDFMNQEIEAALKAAQPLVGHLTCQQAGKVREALVDRNGVGFWMNLKNKLEKFAEASPQIKKCKIDFYDSTYVQDAYLRNKEGLSSKVRAKSFQSVIKICGSYVGLDKFSHFFDQGHEYYEIKKSHGLMSALKLGHSQEEGEYGWMSSFMKSYSDLSANFSGLVFWQELATPGRHQNSFLSCQKGRLVKAKKSFNWCDYINPSWDEAINCFVPSGSRDDNHHRNYIRKNLVRYSKEDGLKYKCPYSEKEYEMGRDRVYVQLKSMGVKESDMDKFMDLILNREGFLVHSEKTRLEKPEAKKGQVR